MGPRLALGVSKDSSNLEAGSLILEFVSFANKNGHMACSQPDQLGAPSSSQTPSQASNICKQRSIQTKTFTICWVPPAPGEAMPLGLHGTCGQASIELPSQCLHRACLTEVLLVASSSLVLVKGGPSKRMHALNPNLRSQHHLTSSGWNPWAPFCTHGQVSHGVPVGTRGYLGK